MIDLHCHMLPGMDDGASDLEVALSMARTAHDDGTTLVACTPHIYPGLFNNDGVAIRRAVEGFRERLNEVGIPLRVTFGADIHLSPNLLQGLRDGSVPCLHGSRYFLLEPPHNVLPPDFENAVQAFLTVGLVPLITHPERLTWVGDHYQLWRRLVGRGAWIQLTAGSLTGRFGASARYWAERLLDEGLVHVLASDGHSLERRPPLLREGVEAVARRLGTEEAHRQVTVRPQGILDNRAPDAIPAPPGVGRSPGSLERFLDYCRQQFRGY